MAERHDTGRRGEAAAADYLRQHGYHILEMNWQSNHQEVDIIARKENIMVFAEVKTRHSQSHGEPEAFVTPAKQRMLVKAANHYLLHNNCHEEARFDIISVLITRQGMRINHIMDAFYPNRG